MYAEMVALFDSVGVGRLVCIQWEEIEGKWLAWIGDGSVPLTGRVIGLEGEGFGSAVDLGAGVEDQLVCRDACIAASGSHVVRRAIDDEVAKERLALPESAVVSFGRVELV